MNVGIVMQNLVALRAAVFTLSGKNLKGGGADIRPPPVGTRVNSINIIRHCIRITYRQSLSIHSFITYPNFQGWTVTGKSVIIPRSM